MTKTTMAVLAISLAVAGAAQAKTNLADGAQTITACVQKNTGAIKMIDVSRAKQISEQIMASAGVSVQWIECGRSVSKEQADAVIDLSGYARVDDHPGSLAYARPFEGMHIVVMMDRLGFAEPRFLPVLLGHVMSHELAHLLQGYSEHSAQGIMKARWSGADFAKMLWQPMRFSADDTFRIQLGLQARRLHRQSAAPPATEAGASPML